MAVSSSSSTSSALSLLHASKPILAERSLPLCCPVRCSSASPPPSPALLRVQNRRDLKRNFSVRSAVEEVFFSDPKSGEDENSQRIDSLKLNLLSVVSGLNRGLVANVDDLERAEAASKELEAAGGIVDLSTDLDRIQGKWKLLYSSAFSSRSLGGSRPGLPTGRLIPVTLGQVFQRIDVMSKDFDNIAEVEIGAPWPFPPVEVTATLAHKFELIGTANIKITFLKTTLKTSGNLSQIPQFDIPRLPDTLRPPSNQGTGDFEVTYLDENMRITRGDRGELRVFVKA